MKTEILSFFLVLAPAVPALFCSACRPEPSVEPVVGFSINVPDYFNPDNGYFKEDGGRVEQPYGLWSGGFDEFKTAITGTKHYESGGSNTIDNDELTITCSGSGYEQWRQMRTKAIRLRWLGKTTASVSRSLSGGRLLMWNTPSWTGRPLFMTER